MELSLEPVYAAPYIQRVYWDRFEADNGFAMSIEGVREVRAMDYSTYATENWGTFQQSFFGDLAVPDMTDLAVDDAFENDIEDTRYSGNVLDMFASSTYSDLQDNIIGEHQYYYTQLF